MVASTADHVFTASLIGSIIPSLMGYGWLAYLIRSCRRRAIMTANVSSAWRCKPHLTCLGSVPISSRLFEYLLDESDSLVLPQRTLVGINTPVSLRLPSELVMRGEKCGLRRHSLQPDMSRQLPQPRCKLHVIFIMGTRYLSRSPRKTSKSPSANQAQMPLIHVGYACERALLTQVNDAGTTKRRRCSRTAS